MKLLVNIRGTNGAGKSTIPMAMLDDPKMHVVGCGYKAEKPCAPWLTVFPTYGWVALGTYRAKTGGMDTMSTNADIAFALATAWDRYPERDILMEGIIASTIKSTYAELFGNYQSMVDAEEVTPRKIVIMSFVPPLEVCLSRVQERNGGKPVKEDAIAGKWRTVDRNVQYFKDMGFTSLRIDNSNIKKESMFKNFLRTCDKYREED